MLEMVAAMRSPLISPFMVSTQTSNHVSWWRRCTIGERCQEGGSMEA